MSAIVPRGYQLRMEDDTREAYAAKLRAVLVVSPTGSGKTFFFSRVAAAAAAKGKRVVIVAHRIEIVEQISAALDRMGIRHGRIMQGHSLTDDIIQVGMVQTVARRLDLLQEPHLLVIDEAHHAVAGTWEKVAAAWRRARLLGVTATPERLDGRGLGNAFEHMILGPSVAELIAEGYLASYQYLAPPQEADFSGVATRAGDYALDEIADAMDKATVTGDAVEHYRQHLEGRSAIAFCVTVAHAEHVAAQFREAGFAAASVDGGMDKATRTDRIAAIGDGRLQVLTSCDIISEGTDIPSVAGAILLRPTKSLSMFLQQVGRVLRPKPDGSKAVILDHVGSVHRHGLPDDPRDWSLDAKKRKPKVPGITTCETCFRAFPQGQARAMAAGCEAEPCPIISSERKPREEMEVLPGQLQVVDAERLAHLRATPLRKLLTGRETREQLEEIRRARGYAAGWTFYILKERRERRAEVAA